VNRFQAATVRVPCSTSNLGSGFDTLGLALDRYLEARFEPGEGEGMEVVRTGTLADAGFDPGEDVLLQALQAGLTEAGIGSGLPGGRLRVDSEIPVARGLGSSAAASVAGWLLAQAVTGAPADPDGAFRTTLDREGHGDNAAPCAYGGLQAVVHALDRTRTLSLPIHPEVGIAYAAPATRVSTHRAREVLPARVSHGAAVAGLGRITALVQGLATADPELVGLGMKDDLHVPHRLALIPGAVNAMSAAAGVGAWGVTISGSGSGLLAFGAVDQAAAIAETLLEILSPGREPGSVAFAVRPERTGGRIVEVGG